MSGRAKYFDHQGAITKVIEFVPHAPAIRVQTQRVIGSSAFSGSKRSQQFLQFVVDNALDGHFDELKERTLGAKLFGREPAYNTNDDAIVRVTACDVRKRLNQFYAGSGPWDFRIELPPGSYIPEFRRISPVIGSQPQSVASPELAAEHTPPAERAAVMPDPAKYANRSRIAVAAAAMVLLCTASWYLYQRFAVPQNAPQHVLPWSALLQPKGTIQVIFCDPEIVTIQLLSNSNLSLSDYANHLYWPNSTKPELESIMQALSFRGVSVAAVDAALALRISHLISPATAHLMDTHPARSVRLADFKTEDAFVLFGSPRSNPWVELFANQLDFAFEFDETRRSEFIRNRHPQSGESASYIPTAEGWGTGQAYAILALVGNPNQGGQVLLLAGSNAEATEAAGKLATDLPQLTQIMKAHGFDPNGPSRHFEILLRVSTMAGSPNTFEVIAFHALPGRTSP
jgi:hypothetical protein